MNDFGVMRYAASGMDAQRSALDVLARNVAVAQTADRTHPVHPLVPQFAIAGGDDDDGAAFGATLAASADAAPEDDGVTGDTAIGGDGSLDDDAVLPGQVAFAGAQPSPQSVTGIDAVSEMVAVLGAQRAFEANATVFDTGKRLVERTLDVERN